MVATNKQRLTKRFVDGLSPGPKRFIAWDTEVPGFGIGRVPRSGVRSHREPSFVEAQAVATVSAAGSMA